MAERTDEAYDVFVSYSPADQAWVRGELLPRLEGAGLRALVDYRDFAIGAPTQANIEQAVERSRKTLLVL
ncbi:MAG: toll/interleukin-1 receptor domain-containing protein, partial [Roseiflexaceae bacterium]